MHSKKIRAQNCLWNRLFTGVPFGDRFRIFANATRLATVLVAKLFIIHNAKDYVVPDRDFYISFNQFEFNQNLPTSYGRLQSGVR